MPILCYTKSIPTGATTKKDKFMTAKQLITPSELWAFYEHKKEEMLTKEEEHFAKKVFQYTVRLLNGIACKTNRPSLNHQTIIHTARMWVKEYEDFKKRYKKFCLIPSSSQQKHTIIQPEKIDQSKADFYSDAITEVLGGQVYTTDNQYTMMRECSRSIFNEKRRGEHRYPRQRS